MSVLVKVSNPPRLQKNAKEIVFFSRILDTPDVSIDYDTIVRVLHRLFVSVPHVVTLQFFYDEVV